MTVKHLSKNKIQIEKVSERKGETDRDTGKAEREREREILRNTNSQTGTRERKIRREG
jgi:hypothetical protein